MSDSVVLSQVMERVRGAAGLVFDFDGTLVDSTPIKAQAFERVFSAFPQRLPEILRYCRSHNHTPRWEKFRWVYEKILGLPYDQATEAELNRQFEAYTTRQIAAAPEIPSAERFIRSLRESHWLGLLSATPHPILLEILVQRGWASDFHRVQGAPVNKGEWLARLRAERGWKSEEMIFFGDTEEDARSAGEAGCLFVAVRCADRADARSLFILDFAELAVARS